MFTKIKNRLTQVKERPFMAFFLALIISMTNVGIGIKPAEAVVGSGFSVSAADLTIILKQIKIAEFHVANTTSATGLCGALRGNGPNQIPSPLLPFGLRTVDGSCNNLNTGGATYGASGQPFPRISTADFSTPGESPPPGPFPPAVPNYGATSGVVYDSQPRIASNLISDQTSTNPSAVKVAENPVRTQADPDRVIACTKDPDEDDPDGTPNGCVPSGQTLFIPNITTDIGLSPPFNSLFTIFGQFFDHGLDKITATGANGSVFVPLKADDPLIAKHNLPDNRKFIPLTRGDIVNDPVIGRTAKNTDTPFVDQNQTYTSHKAHQVYLREYTLVDVDHDNNPLTPTRQEPRATGKFLSTPSGGLATWKMIKDQARTVLGLELVDKDVHNVPEILADFYGNFIPGSNGLPQFVTASDLVEGNRATPVPAPADVSRIGMAFLNDIANGADPVSRTGADLAPENNGSAGTNLGRPPADGFYDNELLDLHYICGDGRCNENIGLTAVHQIFHLEHDRLVDDIKATLAKPTNAALNTAFRAVNLASGPNPNKTFTFEERLFQAARFVTEMEYQHLVFEEFARKVQPQIVPFNPAAFNQLTNDPAITAEFAHAVYRFGHSMLTEQLPRKFLNNSGGVIGSDEVSLLTGFLNPAAFNKGLGGASIDDRQATGALIMGLSDDTGNEIDEFVIDTLRNNLLGLPLDLATINMTRARSEGVASLNKFRREVFGKTNDGQLRPYASWVDFGLNIKHPSSLVNFVAAYGTHELIKTRDPDDTGPIQAGTNQARRIVADQIVNGTTITLPGPDGELNDDSDTEKVDESADNIILLPPDDSADFMFSTNSWETRATGVDDIDLWVGGLAEKTNPFGGLLGSTFNYVFETQLTNLQNSDRFYYLARTPGMNLQAQLEGNSFSELVFRNTAPFTRTLKADPFATSDCKFELGRLTSPAPSGSQITGPGSVADDTESECDENALLIKKPDGTFQYRPTNSVDPAGINGQSVYNGTNLADFIYGGNDNDTFWGGMGNDKIEGGAGDDVALGGDGNDILTDEFGADFMKGGPGNDYINGGPGDDIIIAGEGKDFTNGGLNINETFSGPGDDFAIAGKGTDEVIAGDGNDWMEGDDEIDLLIGDSSTFFFDDRNEPGHDVLIGQGGDDDYDMEGGDDIGVAGPGVEKNAGAAGFDWSISLGDPDPMNADLNLQIVNNPPLGETKDRYDEIEGLSGWDKNDTLRGDDERVSLVGGGGFIGCNALDQAGLDRIAGLDPLVPPLDAANATPLADVVNNSFTNFCLLEGAFAWGEGNILLGGAGSDTIEGRGANDIIDGDRYLNVRLSVKEGVNSDGLATGNERASTGLMNSPAVSGSYYDGAPANTTLETAVSSGKIDSGQIVVVREILVPPAVPADCTAATPLNCDKALYRGPRADYTVTANADESVTVRDNSTVPRDGVDTLWNMEQIIFCDAFDAATNTCTTPAAPVSVPPVASFSVTSLDFGNQTFSPVSKTITVTNTGIKSLLVSFAAPTPAAAGFTASGCTAPVPGNGGTCNIIVQFRPTSTGLKEASLAISHNGSATPVNIALKGTGIVTAPIAQISAPTNPLAFPLNQVVGTVSGPLAITVRNGGTAPLIVSAVTITGTDADSFTRTTNCPSAAPGVNPGFTCTVTVRFRPTSAGNKAASISIAHNAAGSPTPYPVSGRGVTAATTATIAAQDFGNRRIGTSTTREVRVTNTGTAPLVIASATAPAPFATVALGTCNAPVAVGRNCRLNVTFTPTVAGAVSRTLTIVSNANPSPTGTLTGNGRN